MQKKPNALLKFSCGVTMKNRFMLAPLTNQQSYEDGCLSQEELHWLTMRATGQFGIVMTCASHVQEVGKGFSGQLGIFSDQHIPGHKKLAANLKEHGSLAVIQLHHAGMRSPEKLIGQSPVCPSPSEKHGARALTLNEVLSLKNDFIQAAIRAKTCGYDGVEIHGAHGYILTQFLSKKINKRADQYGGNLENRARLLFEIIQGVRASCGPKFLLGVRLSPERFGMDIGEMKSICLQLAKEDLIDFLDISLWDCYKQPEDEAYQDLSLLAHFTSLDLKKVMLTVAGNIRSGKDVHKILNSKVDFVTIGRSAILHHDFPVKVINNPDFETIKLPVSKSHLQKEGLGPAFIDYMSKWEGFVELDSFE